MPLVQCRCGHYVTKQHCRMAFNVCGRARISQGVEKRLSLKAYKNMHMRQLKAKVHGQWYT